MGESKTERREAAREIGLFEVGLPMDGLELSEVRDDTEPEASDLTPEALLDLVEKQGHRCALTGRELTPKNAVVDHVVPVEDGGEHGLANLQVVTKRANRAKGRLTMTDFVALCRAVVRTHC